jgi:hypothetical protein
MKSIRFSTPDLRGNRPAKRHTIRQLNRPDQGADRQPKTPSRIRPAGAICSASDVAPKRAIATQNWISRVIGSCMAWQDRDYRPKNVSRPVSIRALSGVCPAFAFKVRSGCFRSLAVGFAAVFYGENQDGISEIVEADAVVADAETKLWRLDVLEALDIAFAGGEITSHDMQDAERGGLVDSAEVGFGRIGPGDPLPHRYWPLL